MKYLNTALASLLALSSSWSTVAGNSVRGASADASTDEEVWYPQVFSVITSRDIASTYAHEWDIQRTGSRRLFSTDDTDDLVELTVIVNNEAQATRLNDLEQDGTIRLESPEDDTVHRLLQQQQEGFDPDLACYRTVEETYKDVEALAEQYPEFVSVETIGQSWLKLQNETQGNDIKVMVLSAPSDMEKVEMMIVAGHHSRELPPPEVVMRWAVQLLAGYGADADITWILDRTNIHIVPYANPDGREIVQDHLDWYYRKNARPNNCSVEDAAAFYAVNVTDLDGSPAEAFQGVDLNRNYPMFWGNDIGSSSNPCSNSFRGESGLSEPETTAVYDYFQALFAPQDISKGTLEEAQDKINEACPEDATGLFIDIHSAGDFIYFPWGINDTLSPNHRPLLSLAAKLASPGNYTLWGPGQDGFLYFVSGDATDTTYGIDCVASAGYEIGSQFYADCYELETEILPTVYESLMIAAKTAHAPYLLPLGPDIIEIAVDAITDQDLIKVTVAASDEELIVPHTIYHEGSLAQNITGIQLFVDEHPYDDKSKGMDMEPVDGAFDSIDEVAVYTLEKAELEPGRHILYFQATDEEGYVGPASAVFVDIESPEEETGAEEVVERTGDLFDRN